MACKRAQQVTKKSIYDKIYIRWKFEEPISDIEHCWKNSIHLKRPTVLIKTRQKVYIVMRQGSFHKQCLQRIETGVFIFHVRGSQLVGATYPKWLYPRQEGILHRTPKLKRESRFQEKMIKLKINTPIWDIDHNNSNHSSPNLAGKHRDFAKPILNSFSSKLQDSSR